MGAGLVPRDAGYLLWWYCWKKRCLWRRVLKIPIDIHELKDPWPRIEARRVRLAIFRSVNNLGIGAQGLSFNNRVLDVKITDIRTHAASLLLRDSKLCGARSCRICFGWLGPADLVSTGQLDGLPKKSLWGSVEDVRRVTNSVTPEQVKRMAAWRRRFCEAAKMLHWADPAQSRNCWMTPMVKSCRLILRAVYLLRCAVIQWEMSVWSCCGTQPLGWINLQRLFWLTGLLGMMVIWARPVNWRRLRVWCCLP